MLDHASKLSFEVVVTEQWSHMNLPTGSLRSSGEDSSPTTKQFRMLGSASNLLLHFNSV